MGCKGGTTLGVVTGLAAEAKIARRMSAHVVCSASSATRVDVLARGVIAAGATRLLSFGIAGGLQPELTSGDVVIASHICSQTETWLCDPAWVARLTARVPQAHAGLVWGCERIIVTPEDKRQLGAASQCLTADLESHGMAAVAAEAGLPFAAVRVVADGLGHSLPPAALLALRDDGEPDLRAILRDIAAHPAQLPALLRLAHASNKAFVSLRRVAALLAA